MDEVRIAVADGIAKITLNRPDKRNALTQPMLHVMLKALIGFDENPDIRVVWLTAEGTTFCSGMDLAAMQKMREAWGMFDYELLPQVFHRLATQKNPTVATVQGSAVAGGCELALHCDIRIGSPETRLSMPLARLGLVTPIEAVERLVQMGGLTAAQDMLLTGEPLHGERAERLGLLSRLASADSLIPVSEEIVQRIAQNAPLSLRTMKQMINGMASEIGAEERSQLEAERMRVSSSEDMREGLRAYFERRPAAFRGA